MKIHKQKEHSLILKPFGIGGRLYMAVTVLAFFDLQDPDTLLSEQQLWSAIPEQLGDKQVLDMGMPKPRAEVLVSGSCFAPGGTTRTASQVSLRVGPLQKTLSVFGDRFWVKKAGMWVISDPLPFSEIALAWSNAFGGPGCDENPLGKGMAPVTGDDGRQVHPLPNIEYPHRLMGSPADRLPPAGFGPLDLMWPQRAKKQGTYDDKWLKERWPYFPDDMDYEFFNTAPEDQFLEDFFQGGEQIELVNMHPEYQVIRSCLPRVRMRCFVTRRKSLKAAEQEEIFEEVATRSDTLWLFPSIMKAVVMYRGTCRILDDEFADVQRVFVATERLDDPPASIDYYHQQQQKALDRTVDIDTSALQAAGKKIGRAMQRFRNLPKEIEQMKMQALGKAPVMPVSAARMEETSGRMLSDHLALIDRLESQARAMQSKWGHLARIDLDIFDSMRTRVGQVGKNTGQALAKISQAMDKAAAVQKEIGAKLKARVKPGDLAKAGIDPDNLLPPATVNPWHDHGFDFVVKCRRRLENDQRCLEKLQALGLEKRTIRRAWLGLNPEIVQQRRLDWGLDPAAGGTRDPELIELPPGLVLPWFQEAVLKRILVLSNWQEGAPELVPADGSDNQPLFLPAACLIDLPGVEVAASAPAVAVADDFQALLVEQEVGDACSVIVLDEAAKKPGKEAAACLEKAPALLVVTRPDLDDQGWEPWQKAYANARRLDLPAGSTVFQARAAGCDIRAWIMEGLGPELAAGHQVEPALPESGKPPSGSPLAGMKFSNYDVAAMVKGLSDQIRAFHQPKLDAADKSRRQIFQKARQVLAKAGQDPDRVLGAEPPPSAGPAEAGAKIAARLRQQKEKLRAAGRLTPEIESQLDSQAAKAVQMGKEGQQRLKKGLAQLEETRIKAAQVKASGIPEDFREKFTVHGLDPEKMQKLTRQQVVERHSRGQSLAGAVLNGLDLSGLDLKGIDLAGAQCRKTNFSGADLSGADLSQALAMEADFSRAVMRKVRCRKGVFTRACFREADLGGADLGMSVLQEADLCRADCTGVKFHMTVLQKAVLQETDFSTASIDMSVFSGADATGARFCKACLEKCLFKDTVVDRADFSGAALPATQFQGARGAGLKFTGADLSKTRTGGGTDFSGADFSGITMKQGCFRQTVLAGADFSGARLEESMLEDCDLKNTRLYRVSMPRTRLAKCDLEGVDMRQVNLFLGSLRKARLVSTDLRGANLFGVDFYKAVMGNTRLEGANCKLTLIQDKTEYLK